MMNPNQIQEKVQEILADFKSRGIKAPPEVQEAIALIKTGLNELGSINSIARKDNPEAKQWGVKITQKCNPTQMVDVEPPEGDGDAEPSDR